MSGKKTKILRHIMKAPTSKDMPQGGPSIGMLRMTYRRAKATYKRMPRDMKRRVLVVQDFVA